MKYIKTILTSLLLMLCINASSVANEGDWMPDANLRTAVQTALGLGNADTLTKEAMTNLTQLRAERSNIANITGLEHATNLTDLQLPFNQITDISPLRTLTNLTNLVLDNNPIGDITALGNLTDLKILQVKNCGITDVSPLLTLVNLTTLRIALNDLTNISPLRTLTNLTNLALDNNPIGDITALGNLTDLKILQVKNCGITDVSPLLTLVNLTTLRIAVNDLTNAHLLSTLTNLKDIDITIPDPPPADVDPPGVSLTIPSVVQNGAFSVTITFTESVSGFTESDLSLSGTATASITAWRTTNNTTYIADNTIYTADSTTYTATITPTTGGTVILNVATNVATDPANNPNTAAETKTVNVDVDRPTVTIGVPSGTQTGAFDATITFSKTVSDFAQSDVSLTGTAASITAWNANNDNTVYTATITPTASGSVTINVAANVAKDAANNPNTAATAKTVTVDVDAPSVSISVPSDAQNGAFDTTITFSETVSDFAQSDVSLTGAAASITAWNANANNTIYTATITPTASGTVTINVAANVAKDAANNPNTAATAKTVSVDVDKPTVTIGVPSGTQTGAFNTTITFSETVSGFAQSDVALTGAAASITAWNANNNTVYTATITPTASGSVTINVPVNVAKDAANNPNTAATGKNVTVSLDTTAPSVSITVPTGPENNAFDATITFTEAVSGFTQSDLSLSGTATVSITSWNANNDNTTYTATITPTTSGTVIFNIEAGVATDAANNNNTAATAKTVNVDVDSPTVTIGVPSGTQTGAFDATITFSETVSDFAQSDVSLTGAAASITAWNANNDNTVYTAAITPTANGTVTINVAADVATDAAGNNNTAATAKNVTVTILVRDTTAPSVSITAPSAVQNGAFSATITFTEVVSDFVQADLSLTGTATASITAWNTTDNITYTATITPTNSGTVILNVAANVAKDAADNPNTAATAKTVNVDVDKPTVTIGVPSGTQAGAFNTTITFSETVSGFAQSDVSLTGSAASITAWNADNNKTVYTATVTPTASGTVTINVAANVAKDAANNPNTAATAKTVTVLSDAVNIPDPNLRAAIEKALGKAAGATITEADMATLTELGVRNSKVSDLTGLGSATNLTALTLSYNSITGLSPITGLTKLTSLDLGNNSITDLSPLSGLTSLTKLELQSNSITNLSPLAGLTNLKDLYLKDNSITDIRSLVSNTGLGRGDTVDLRENALDTDAINTHIPTLQSRGVTVLFDALRVSISVPSAAQNGAFDTTITFTEAVSDFTQSDLSLSGTATASITAWNTTDNTTYAATITPTNSGTVIFNIEAGVATDAADNPNTAAETKTVNVDIDKPTVTIGVPSGTQTGAFDATITFSETVSDFAQSDVSLTGSAASITTWSANNKNTVYTATITPTASGTVTINIAANVAKDAANNPNTAATAKTVNVDIDKPTVTIGVPSGTQTGAFDATITFSETVSDFAQSDVALTGAAASITAWNANANNTIYTATITPTASGTVTVNVAANVAKDAANNPNTAATAKTVTVAVTDVNENRAPTFNEGSSATRSIAENTGSGVNIGSAVSATDPDNDTLTYSLGGTDAASFSIVSTSGQLRTSAALDYETDTSYTVTITVSDGKGGSDSISVTINVTDVNENRAPTFNEGSSATRSIAENTGSGVNIGSAVSATDPDNDTLTYSLGGTDASSFSINSTNGQLQTSASLDFENKNSYTVTVSVSDGKGGSDSISVTINVTNVNENGVVNIPDPNLRAAIEEALGKTSGATITEADMATLTSLDVLSMSSDTKIFNLTGIEYAINLTTLKSWGNRISDISPVKGLTKLTKLKIGNQGSQNGIKDISAVAGLTNLTYLAFEYNGISDISPIAGLTNLTELNLRSNNLTNISAVAGLTNLTRLVINRNNISDISPVARLTKLTVLGCLDNAISNLSPLAGLTELTALYFWGNAISDISPLAGLTKLTELNLTQNSISDISPLAGLTKLTELSIWNNNITDMSPVKGLTNLTELYISWNDITDISPVKGLTNLKKLSLQNNLNISDISVVAGLTKLTQLRLSNNSISDLSPLVANTGLRRPGYIQVDVSANPLSAESINTHIPALRNRGVTVTADNLKPPGAPSIARSAPVFSVSGAIVDQTARQNLFRITVKNLSNAEAALTINTDGEDYQLEVEAGETGDILEISAQSADPSIAVQPLRYTLTAEDVLRGRIQLPALVAYEIPTETKLLANYPNPFNPETWIPYRLAADAFVTLTIYDSSGQIVRTIDVGHQIAAVYESRSKAIHWDGRNASGEPVSSGVYFYHLSAGDYSATRRMLILK